ncbi:DNA-binding protein [Sphingobacterium cellulitidis]|uniref:helix-turn-helix domain-containing protein n=1 Tax=Sphingobacterium cellulitidis TaxID=1768011 RepID=UPI000B93B25F|nr:helix-turn-helix domain-containing protein [Sphingobacterium cellulitidis]OYD46540.1 DNA-binding protein [Sphingobacterium cellulitidis]
MVKIELLTKADLEDLKNEIVQEIKALAAPASAPPRQWLKSVEVRKMLNISPGTLQNMRINGTLPYTKVGSILYYRYEDIVKLLEGNHFPAPNGKL